MCRHGRQSGSCGASRRRSNPQCPTGLRNGGAFRNRVQSPVGILREGAGFKGISQRTLLKNVVHIPPAMQNSDHLQGLHLGTMNDEVGINWEKSDREARDVLATVACA